MSKKHRVIVIPGLGDEVGKMSWAVKRWRKFGLEPVVHSVGWHDDEKKFQPKLRILVEMIDRFAHDGDRVSLVGCSAGGSAVLNAFFESREDLLSDHDRKRIMTVRALFGDELVPADTVMLYGAYNTTVPTPEHVLSILMALTVFSSPLITFLTKKIK